jgi:radical SAM protein with 4Fe4S-binding SPASM domain
MLSSGGVRVRLKAMALRSNLDEMEAIAHFCRKRTKDYFRFDPQLHLRFDGNQERNEEIRSERLAPEEIIALDRIDKKRLTALQKECGTLLTSLNERSEPRPNLFRCAIGNGSCSIGYDGIFRACSSLCAPGMTCDLRKDSLRNAWENLIPKIRMTLARRPEFLTTCGSCPYSELCTWCPAHAHLETGDIEGETPYFCAVTHARIQQLNQYKKD